MMLHHACVPGDAAHTQGVPVAARSTTLSMACPLPINLPRMQKYIFVLTKYFPGDDAVTQTCTGEFPMPDATTATEVRMQGSVEAVCQQMQSAWGVA